MSILLQIRSELGETGGAELLVNGGKPIIRLSHPYHVAR